MRSGSPGRSVFISATNLGLATWRKRLVKILNHNEIDPIEEEYFQPEAERVRTCIEKAIDRSTGVICIVGPYFGSILIQPNGKPPVSYSQYEWMYAIKRKKPLRVYITGDAFFRNGSAPSNAVQEVESPQLKMSQDAFRSMIVAKKEEYFPVSSEVDLALRLAEINWNLWPHE